MSLPSSKSSPSSKASSEQELYRLGHKKRQRVRNRELKQLAVYEILDRLPPFHELPLAPSVVIDDKSIENEIEIASTSSDSIMSKKKKKEKKELTLADLYRPIPNIEEVLSHSESNSNSNLKSQNHHPFWKTVPSVCNPRLAVLSGQGNISDQHELGTDIHNRERYRRKLQYKKDRQEITQSEFETLWKQHGKRITTTPTVRTTMMTAKRIETVTTRHNVSSDSTIAAAVDVEGVSLLSNDRGQRKAWQVENFVSILYARLSPYRSSSTTDNDADTNSNDNNNNDDGKFDITVVDFGCGSGNLCLALAPYFTKVRFVLVDKKTYPLKLAKRRARGLKNVQVLQFSFTPSNFDEFCIPPMTTTTTTTTVNDDGNDMKKTAPIYSDSKPKLKSASTVCTSFDIAIGLHCCGSFTDMVMSLAKARGADCIVCPCCNGSMTSKTTSGYQYPRSSYIKQFMNQNEYLSIVSKAAEDSGIYEAKCLIEFDRALWGKENGYDVQLLKMTPENCTPKHHVLYLTNTGNPKKRGKN